MRKDVYPGSVADRLGEFFDVVGSGGRVDDLVEVGFFLEDRLGVKGGENLSAHPLLSEIQKHVDCVNRLLDTIGSIIKDRGEKPEQADDDLEKFRLNA